MYNKLFTKILNSSIWLQPLPTRVVWLTLIASMDEDGFAQFATVGNIALRANVSLDDAQAAIAHLESPDPESSDPDFAGKRIERVPGGWIVLNAKKHREMVTATVVREQTRERVRRYRDRKRTCNADVTPSETETETETKTETDVPPLPPTGGRAAIDDGFDRFWSLYPKKVGKGEAKKAWHKRITSEAQVQRMLAGVARQKRSVQWTRDDGRFIPNPATWLNQERWDDEPDPDVPHVSDRMLSAGRSMKAFLEATDDDQ